jgi:hypothetical protein
MPLFTFAKSYANCSKDLQFITIAATLALVLATSVAGAAVGKSVRSYWCLFIIFMQGSSIS